MSGAVCADMRENASPVLTLPERDGLSRGDLTPPGLLTSQPRAGFGSERGPASLLNYGNGNKKGHLAGLFTPPVAFRFSDRTVQAGTATLTPIII